MAPKAANLNTPKYTESLPKMCRDDENDVGIYDTLSLRSNY